MEFRRVDALPPYAFAEVERLKLELRRDGRDVIDLGFGNPDVAPPELTERAPGELSDTVNFEFHASQRTTPRSHRALPSVFR